VVRDVQREQERRADVAHVVEALVRQPSPLQRTLVGVQHIAAIQRRAVGRREHEIPFLSPPLIASRKPFLRLPHGAPRTALLHILMEGRGVDFYRHVLSDELVLDIEPEQLWHERRWSAPAWVAYCAGEHMAPDDDGRECRCAECNERRQQEARDRYNALQAALQAARAAAERDGEPSA
jgi:hypothetical protein